MMDLKFEHLIKEYPIAQKRFFKKNASDSLPAPAIRRVLEIEVGGIKGAQITGVIGPNGAGKSTLLNIVAGLDLPTQGKVYYGIDGEFSDRIPQKQLTLVFQNPYLIDTTVEGNIAYPLKLRGWEEKKIDERVSELLEELGLSDLRKQRSRKLSGGEMQKVALARALSFQPELLLLDEPTANIDPATTAEIERMLLKINREKKTTIILITHNLVQARRLCDELLFFHKGKLVESGACREILAAPKKEETEKFVAGELLW